MKMSKKSKVILYILLTIVAVYFLAPFVYMLLTTFKTEGEPSRILKFFSKRLAFLKITLRHGAHSRSEPIS